MKIFKYVFKGLGSILHISLIVSDKKEADNLIKKVYQISSDFEKKYSRFIPNSLLSILNNEKKLKIDQDFLGLLIKSKEIYDFTNGFFNPLVNLSNIGYGKSWEINNFDFEKNKENLDFNKIGIFGDTVVLQDGMNLDFGAIGKGYLSDLIAKFLKLNNVNNF
ncbi:FAD:protein FMN transferase [Candidatus Vampirococcus lugosii]|uniref:FAD:protein FMN transferase n=1 Tax=Candidatus Vampirococcus lugosii TaxID=2789015 RepID=A0ABS5QL48_9BACT|nr:FAD:protein FMN transferase [Candidatus Vampirococcus lugosii]MBS8121829.1 Thiamine biosynthesis lipoprotein ApbE [Candidatus Vampirococcus lugosii]